MKVQDILTADENIIVHQVNNLGVMGAGLALQIRKKYPKVFEAYRKTAQELGKVQLVKIGENKYICNMFSQNGISRHKRTTNYEAMEECIATIVEYAKENEYSIAIPYKIGCGLAGGDWNKVKDIIEKYDDGRITIYRKE